MINISDEEKTFLNNLHDKPNDEAIRLVYADWLDEHDEPDRANYLRTLVKVRNDFNELNMATAGVDGDWMSSVSSGEEEYEAYVALKGLKLQPLNELLKYLKINGCGTLATINFDSLLGDTIREKYEGLYLHIIDTFNIVMRKSTKEGNGWICTSPEIASIFEVVNHAFQPSKYFATYCKMDENKSPHFVGTLAGKFKMYIHTSFPTNTILIGIGSGQLPPENLAQIQLIYFNGI